MTILLTPVDSHDRLGGYHSLAGSFRGYTQSIRSSNLFVTITTDLSRWWYSGRVVEKA